MKTLRLSALFFALAAFTFSCGEPATENNVDTDNKEMHDDEAHDHGHDHEHEGEMHNHDDEEGHTHDADASSDETAAYHCPMKCEEDKTYAEAGTCPKCKMDLVAMEDESSEDESESETSEEGSGDEENV